VRGRPSRRQGRAGGARVIAGAPGRRWHRCGRAAAAIGLGLSLVEGRQQGQTVLRVPV
jgi:hypothetical protein